MKKKPSTYATLFTSTLDEAMLFDMWFRERSLDCAVRPSDDSDEASVVDADMLERSRGDYDGNIAVGQVRILSKRFTETPEAVPFVVVLEKWEARGGDDDMWLVAPFSQYSTPATSGEMSSGENLLWREVIQTWNARTVQGSLLKKSYLCGALGENAVREARALFRNQFAGTALPSDFSALRGPAILLEGDPRRDYVSEAISRLQPLSTAVKASERFRAEAERLRLSQEFGRMFAERIGKPKFIEEEMKLAAGKRKPRIKSYDVGGISLDLEYSPESEDVTMTFYDENDEAYRGYDGYGLFGTNQEFLGTFGRGFIRVPAESVRDSFMIADSDGEMVKVEERA